jgi:hypothetical protein
MENNRMLGTEEAVVVGTEGGPGPTGGALGMDE